MEDQELGMPGIAEEDGDSSAILGISASNGNLSILERAGLRFKQAQGEKKLEIIIPGFGGEIVAMFRPIDFDVARRLQMSMQKSMDKRKELNYACDIIARHCEGIYGKDIEGDGHLVDLVVEGPQPRFDLNLVKIIPELRHPGETDEQMTARVIIRRTFVHDMAVIGAFSMLQGWTDGTDETAQEILQGE